MLNKDVHYFTSRTICLRMGDTAAGARCADRLAGLRVRSCAGTVSCSASAVSGSTSAWALSVSISTARLDCTIFWSARAWARLISEETWLWAVLIAARADLDLGRRVDAGDERGIQDNAVARGGRGAFALHVFVQVAQILAQVVDRHAGDDAHLAVRAVVVSAAGASKLAMRSRSTETK